MTSKTATLLRTLSEMIAADKLSANKAGEFIARRSFFYRNGKTAKNFEASVASDLSGLDPKVFGFSSFTILESGEIDKPFRGGAPIEKQSHWFVRFSIQ